jgi:acyl-ACP thioesterase
MKPTPLYKKDYKVNLNHVDFKGNMKLSSLFTYFQDIADLHSENLKMGRKVLYEQYGVIWVLVRMRVDIIKYPKWKDIITVETWPQEPGRIGFDRDFLIKDSEGNILVKSVSTWVVIDIESRKLRKTKSVFTGYPPVIEERAIDCKLGNLKAKGELEMAYKRTVRYSDIDVNGHLNNAKYLDFIMDSFTLEEHKGFDVKSIEMSYSNEALPGDTINIYRDESQINSNILYMEGIDERDNLIFKSQIEIEKK